MKATEERARIAVKNILFATDFSNSIPLPYVASIARRYNSRVHLAHVIVSETFPLVGSEVTAQRSEEVAQNAKQQLAELSGQLEGIERECVVAHGGATEVLTELIRERKIDLVVVGTHGRVGLKRFLLGSVAEEVFRKSPCPVLTIGPHVSKIPPRELAFRNVFCPTDLLKESFCAVPYAVSLASDYSANLTLLHVLPEVTASQPGFKLMVRELERQMKMLIPYEAMPGREPEFLVEFGKAVETILRIAKERQADLIVLGVKEADPLASHLRGNIAYQIVVRAECPVLSVRAQAQEQE